MGLFQLETDEAIVGSKARKALELYQHKVSFQIYASVCLCTKHCYSALSLECILNTSKT